MISKPFFYRLLQLILTCSFSKIHYITIRYVKPTVSIYIHAARSAERPKMLNRMLKHDKVSEPRMRGIHLQPHSRRSPNPSADRARGYTLHAPGKATQAGVQATLASLTSQIANFCTIWAFVQ